MTDLTARLEKLYTGAVYDVMHELGLPEMVLPPTMKPVNPLHRLAGEIFTIDGLYDEGLDHTETLRRWAQMLSSAPVDKVLVCQPNSDNIAVMGELSAETLQRKGVRGYLADGGCRDIEFLLKLDFPVWRRFDTPKDIVGRWLATSMGKPIEIGGVQIRAGDYLLADLDGAVC